MLKVESFQLSPMFAVIAAASAPPRLPLMYATSQASKGAAVDSATLSAWHIESRDLQIGETTRPTSARLPAKIASRAWR